MTRTHRPGAAPPRARRRVTSLRVGPGTATASLEVAGARPLQGRSSPPILHDGMPIIQRPASESLPRPASARCGAAVASCPVRRGGGFLPGAARRWLLARCCAAVASCPVRLGGGFWPGAARQWLLARCCAAVASCPLLRGSGFVVISRRMYCARIARVGGCQSFGNVEQQQYCTAVLHIILHTFVCNMIELYYSQY